MMGDTPLARAAHNGHFQTVQYLVEQGAEVDGKDIGDNTALHWAAMRGHVEIVKYLVDCGADKYEYESVVTLEKSEQVVSRMKSRHSLCVCVRPTE